MPALPKATRDARLTEGVTRLKAMVARNRAILDALPLAAVRTNAQKNQARDARDAILLCRFCLLLGGAADLTDVTDGSGTE